MSHDIVKNETYGFWEVSPKPSQEELDHFYKSRYYGEGVSKTYQVSYSPAETDQKVLRAQCTMQLVKHSLGTDTEIHGLEVGCGEGFVLDAARHIGIDLTGVDYQSAPVKTFNAACLDKFIEANPNDYLERQIALGKSYDFVILQNVLEHVIDPINLLCKLKSILNDNGILLLQVPNDCSELQDLALREERVSRQYWVSPPQHLSYFNKETLLSLIEGLGFEFVDGIADFPIELYLWGHESNYVQDRDLGPFAHKARVTLDLFISRSGMDKYIEFYRSCFQVGIGRSLIVTVRK